MTVRIRVIPCLDVANGRVVKGVHFVDIRDAGDPVECAKAYCKAGADELALLGPGATFSPGASGEAYGPYHTAGTYLIGSASTMQIGVSFLGSGAGDTYSLSTSFTVNPVPEPGTLALFGFGLAGAAASYRRKRAAKKA